MKAELEAFVLREARLLDERRFADWLALFAEDGVYWVPTLPAQASPQEALSLFYEPKPLLAMRIARLERPEMHAQAPASRTLHHVSGIEVSGLEAHSALVVAEWRLGEARWFAARVTHKFRKDADGLRIVLKRVDLIDSEAPQRAIAIPF